MPIAAKPRGRLIARLWQSPVALVELVCVTSRAIDKRRHNARQLVVAVIARQHGLDTGHEWSALEKPPDRDCLLQGQRIPFVIGTRAKLSVQICGGGDAAGKRARPGLQQRRLIRRKYSQFLRQAGDLAGIGNVAGGILQSRNAVSKLAAQPSDQLHAKWNAR